MAEKISPLARVLVVDDESLIRWSLNERLSSEGYEVHEAGDGSSALAHFREGGTAIDVTVLDLRLPDTDGVTLLVEIKRVCPHCQVIVMTAFGTPATLSEARDRGAYEIVIKPFDLDSMVQTVGQALAGARSRQQPAPQTSRFRRG